MVQPAPQSIKLDLTSSDSIVELQEYSTTKEGSLSGHNIRWIGFTTAVEALVQLVWLKLGFGLLSAKEVPRQMSTTEAEQVLAERAMYGWALARTDKYANKEQKRLIALLYEIALKQEIYQQSTPAKESKPETSISWVPSSLRKVGPEKKNRTDKYEARKELEKIVVDYVEALKNTRITELDQKICKVEGGLNLINHSTLGSVSPGQKANTIKRRRSKFNLPDADKENFISKKDMKLKIQDQKSVMLNKQKRSLTNELQNVNNTPLPFWSLPE